MLRSYLLLTLLVFIVPLVVLAQGLGYKLTPIGEPVDLEVANVSAGGDNYLLLQGEVESSGTFAFDLSTETAASIALNETDLFTEVVAGGVYTLLDRAGELFVTDGTQAGTVAVLPNPTNSSDSGNGIIFFDGKFYGLNLRSSGSELYSIEPTTGIRTVVKTAGLGYDAFGNNLVIYNGKLTYALRNEDNDRMMIWSSDGTTAGTEVIAELSSFELGDVAVVDDQLLVYQDGNLFTLEEDNTLQLRSILSNGGRSMLQRIIPVGRERDQEWLFCGSGCQRLTADFAVITTLQPYGYTAIFPLPNGEVVQAGSLSTFANMLILDPEENQYFTLPGPPLVYVWNGQGSPGTGVVGVTHLREVTIYTSTIFNEPTRNLHLYSHSTGEMLDIIPPTMGSERASSPVKKNNIIYVTYQENGMSQLYRLDIDSRQSITGNIFYDRNSNGIRDAGESGMNNIKVTAAGQNDISAFSDTSGNYTLYLNEGETYEITSEDLNCRTITVMPEETTVTYAGELIENFDFGYGNAIQNNPSLAASIISGPPRCGFEVPFWVNMLNDGCKSHPAELQLTLPDNVTLVSATPEPVQSGNQLTWNFDEQIEPGDNEQVLLVLRMPGEDFVDDLIELTAVAVVPTTTTVSDTFLYSRPLQCAIDPNDKQVRPARPEPSNSNYTRFDETLTYTVRFQNTGNDTAFTVRIEDQLSTDLDWTTFRPISGSHSFQTSLNETGVVQFLFENILLPDSLTNEPASHGYVTFEVDFIEAIAEGAAVSNTAGIYFDFNRPVITNTVVNTAVEFLDQDQDGFFFWNECDDENENINPDAPDLTMNGIDENCDDEDGISSVANYLPGELNIFPNPTTDRLTLNYSISTQLRAELYDLRGQQLLVRRVTETAQFNLNEFPAGAYLLRLTDLKSGQFTVRKVFKE